VLISDSTESTKKRVLEENKRFRDLLFAYFSHELRTPLNCILLMLGKILKVQSKLPDKIMKKYIYPTFYSSQILLHLVNDILDYTFLLRDEFHLKYEEVDIEKECLEGMELISIQAKSKQIKLDLKLDNKVPSTIQVDSARLKQILCHFLLNALKYTYSGSIYLKVKNSKDYEGGITFSIKDTGIGMDLETQKRLKEKLQITSLTTYKVSENSAGASLRTLLSQTLVHIMGYPEDEGIKFKSETNRGTKFWFTIRNNLSDESQMIENYSSVANCHPNKLNERHHSGITIKWFSSENILRSKDLANEKSVKNCRKYVKPKSIDTKRKSLGDLAFLKDNPVRSECDEVNSIFSERGGNISPVPEFSSNGFMQCKINHEFKGTFSLQSQKPIESLAEIALNHSGTNPPKSCIHPKILVVDDDDFNILAVKNIFKQKDLTISYAWNGKLAIELIDSEIKSREHCCKKFLLILMDVNMPVMGGLEASCILKKKMQLNIIPWMPIVACTAFVGANDEARCRENGMDDYLTKPLNEKKITKIINQWGLHLNKQDSCI
jgi:CheY-like chemotaxis protein